MTVVIAWGVIKDWTNKEFDFDRNFIETRNAAIGSVGIWVFFWLIRMLHSDLLEATWEARAPYALTMIAVLIVASFKWGQSEGRKEGYWARLPEVSMLGTHILDLYDEFEVPEESRAIKKSDVTILRLHDYAWPSSTICRLEPLNPPVKPLFKP